MPVSADPGLVYDVGMHNGDDTAYYLHRGYRVLAVEANPELVRQAEQRFAAEIAAARLRIAPVAVAALRGEADLFISPRFDAVASLDEQRAAVFGRNVRRIRVPCVPFGELLAEHGVPGYLKIDIEGSDSLCLAALDPSRLPRYLSIEMSHDTGDQDIRRLQALGYRGFKCVRQNDLAVIGPASLGTLARMRRLRARGGAWHLAVAVAGRMRRSLRPVRDGQWRFPRGSSGPFGAQLVGEWLTAEQMLQVWQTLHEIDARLGDGGLGEWFDIHAWCRC
jgi:FkbM family methyltransferase